MTFSMPPLHAGYPARGAWLLLALADRYKLTHNRAGGITGNLGYESEGLAVLQEEHPTVKGSLGGYGWGQWTGPRRHDFMSWCQKHQLEPKTDEANWGYLCYEFDGPYAYVIRDLMKVETLEDSVFCVGRYYEAPGGTTATHLPGYAGRLSRAKEALAPLAHIPAGMTDAQALASFGEQAEKGWSAPAPVEEHPDPVEKPAETPPAVDPAPAAAEPGTVDAIVAAVTDAVTSTVEAVAKDVEQVVGGKAKK
jgi:hypothetical protein